MGNMYNLYNSGSLWKKIKKTLDDQDSYGMFTYILKLFFMCLLKYVIII